MILTKMDIPNFLSYEQSVVVLAIYRLDLLRFPSLSLDSVSWFWFWTLKINRENDPEVKRMGYGQGKFVTFFTPSIPFRHNLTLMF